MSLVNVAYCIYIFYNIDEDQELRFHMAEVWEDGQNEVPIDLIYGDDFRKARRDVFEQYGSRVNREAVCNEPPGELTNEEWTQLLTSVVHDNVDGKGSHEHTFEIYN